MSADVEVLLGPIDLRLVRGKVSNSTTSLTFSLSSSASFSISFVLGECGRLDGSPDCFLCVREVNFLNIFRR